MRNRNPPGGKKKGGRFPPYALFPPFSRLLPLVLRRRSHRHRIHTHLHPLFVLVLELHVPIYGGEQRVIRRPPHIPPRMKLRPALPHDDAARGHEFPAEPLHAEVFRDRGRSEEHTSELQSRLHLVCRLLLEKKKKKTKHNMAHLK